MYRMAGDTHKKQGNMRLPETPAPRPLRAFFPCDEKLWSKSQINAAIEITKASKWRDCIETIIASVDNLPLENPRYENGKYIFSGEASLTIKVRHDAFLKRLGEWPPIDAKLESKIRNDLNSANKEGTDQA